MPRPKRKAKAARGPNRGGRKGPPNPPAPAGAPAARTVGGPSFAQPAPSEDPTHFRVKHASDTAAYHDIDELNREHKLAPLPFPAPRGGDEPVLTLEEALGDVDGASADTLKMVKTRIDQITNAEQIVFHSGGDIGSTRGPTSQELVVNKMLGDFNEASPAEIPQFHLMLGDIVYSFGEAQYYYDQFYEPYRDYPAPILAAAGNHDGMVSPVAGAKGLSAFLRNFCADSFIISPDAGGLSRTAQIQPGVFFTFEAPLVRILVLYSNTLEDPGCIANATIGNSQLDYLEAALTRVKKDGFEGAVLIAMHHPPYTAGSRHGWSIDMGKQIDEICEKVGKWPHAVLSGHAHNQQRFTRTRNEDGSQIPYVICGNCGHGIAHLSKSGTNTLRAPQVIQRSDQNNDLVVLESYDDQNYGYLRIIVTTTQLRIEYHPAGDGTATKSPDDAVTVDLTSRKLVHYSANDLGHPDEAKKVRAAGLAQRRRRNKAR
jgi:hypothetical protein